MRPIYERALFAVAAAGAGVSMLSALVFVVTTLHSRRYGIVEAEMVFEALRVRHGFPLYFDPIVGANEYGPPPTRYFVLYTPVWPRLLSWIGPDSLLGLRSAGRVFNSVVWFSFFAFIVRVAPKVNRGATLVACGVACGSFFIARETTLACGDTLACVLAALGLHRAIRKGEMDTLAAVLLATAPFLKPNVIGCAVSVAIGHILVKRAEAWRSLLVAAGVVAAWFITCRIASDGLWPVHMLRATGQTMSLERLGRELSARGIFLGVPHLVVAVLAFRSGASTILKVALAGTLGLATLLMAKHGSGSHYFIEPTLVAVIAVSETPWKMSARLRIGSLVASCVLTWLVALNAIKSFSDDVGASRYRSDLVVAMREACPLGPGEIAMSSDLVLELELDNRVAVPLWQTTYLLRNGTFPVDVWARDLADPHVRCLIHGAELNDPVPAKIDGITEVGAFRKELRAAVDENFVYDRTVMGWLVLKRR